MEIKDTKLKKIVAMVKGTNKNRLAYPKLVEHLIRQRYNISQEFAVQRQRDTEVAEFNAYNAYCEECKVEAKRMLEIED